MKLLSIGDNGALIYPESGMMYPAGSAAAVAAYASRLGYDADYLGVFGNDGAARLTKDALVNMGIGITQCRFSALPSTKWTTAADEKLPAPDNDYELLLEMPLALNARDFAYAAGFDGIYTCAAAHIDHRLHELINAGPVICYDFADLWRWDSLRAVCPNVHLAFFDARSLSDYEAHRFLASVCNLGCYLAVATLGERGVLLATKRGCTDITANAVCGSADRHGESDAFIAAFLGTFCSFTAFRRNALASSPEFPLDRDDEYRFEDAAYAACVAAGQYLASRASALHGSFDCGVPIR